MIKQKKVPPMDGVEKYLKGKKEIFDVGTGPSGSRWWQEIDKDASITGIDLNFFPKTVPNRVKIYKMDANKLGRVDSLIGLEQMFPRPLIFKRQPIDWINKFDMVVANHVLEHVESPTSVVEGMSKMLKKGGIVYAGFPESTNFTDIFYHLVHPNNGGHIQLLTKDSVREMFKKEGFKLVSCNVWPDDWGWLRTHYNWKSYMWPDNKYLDQQKIDYLCDTFLKELTPEKGYFYGWEMVFEKI